MEQHLILIGINYRTAPVDVREKFALTNHCAADSWCIPVGATAGNARIDEALILSTCNRVEVLVSGTGDGLAELCTTLWADACGQPATDLSRFLYQHLDIDAIRHLFSVASSLDSMVLGEPQILGQLKEAYRKATAVRTTGPLLNHLLHKAFSVAKRVRTETEIASNAVSISYAAVELAKRIFGDMHHYKAMLIGAGEMAELAATHLLQAGLSQVMVTNRTFERARDLANHFNGIAVPMEQMIEHLADADIVISSTGAPDAILHEDDIEAVLKRRRNKPMFFIDIAVPRDIDPDVNNLDNVYLYDIDDLREVVEENVAKRKDEAIKAASIVDDETETTLRWMRSLSLQPSIVDLMDHLNRLADNELAKTCRHIGNVPDEMHNALQIMLHSLVGKIAHNPLEYMKQAHERGEMEKLRLIRDLFALDEPLRHRHFRHSSGDR